MPAPVYNPPAGNNVVMNFTSPPAYSIPPGNAVPLNFTNAVATTGRRREILTS